MRASPSGQFVPIVTPENPGSTFALPDGASHTLLRSELQYFNPTGAEALATAVLNLPVGPSDGDEIVIGNLTTGVGSLALTPAAGNFITAALGASFALPAGTSVWLKFNKAALTWLIIAKG